MNPLEIASTMLERREFFRGFFGNQWPEVSKPWRAMLLSTMNETGNSNPLSAVLPIAKRLSAKGENPSLLLAVAVDLAEEK